MWSGHPRSRDPSLRPGALGKKLPSAGKHKVNGFKCSKLRPLSFTIYRDL